MHLYHKMLLLGPSHSYFISSSNIHNYCTRSNFNLTYFMPNYRLARLQKPVKYIGVKVWNEIKKELKLLSFNKFKRKLKLQLISKY